MAQVVLISEDKKSLVHKLYYESKYSMSQIAKEFGVSLDSVVSFMRRNKMVRRTPAETNAIQYQRKAPSFTKNLADKNSVELQAILAMLYWGEGYKGSVKLPARQLDFANSDPDMIRVFLSCLRKLYKLKDDKFRIFLYCYSDQDVSSLIEFWSKETNIPTKLFIKPYVRKDFNDKARKMKYGLIHIRYHDKKLLLEILKMIDYYKSRFAS